MHSQYDPVETDNSMSGRIKEARQARGWSQQELAERVSVSQPTIVHWEQGTHTPRHLALARLADALGVSRHWLQSDKESPSGEVVTTIATQPRPRNVLKDYLSLPLRHVPVFSPPLDRTEIAACLRGERMPVGYCPVASASQNLLGLIVDDPGGINEFPNGSIAIVDCSDLILVEGKYYLFASNGTARLRRWIAPLPSLSNSTSNVMAPAMRSPDVLGRVVMSTRTYT
jgi:transcriptional regulator with XRE-family HTH domain